MIFHAFGFMTALRLWRLAMRTFTFVTSILVALLWAGSAQADVDIRVGSGNGCFSANIQTAINNAVLANGVTNIKIARNVAYNAQQLDINGRNVRLIGGFADCNQANPDTTKTLLNGAGGSANTVVTVRGSSNVVEFQNLDVTGGDEVTTSVGRGGGFTIAGGPHQLVRFNNVLIHGNQAGYGGGIYIENENSSTAADVFVHLDNNVSINGNYGAYGGGGIWCRNSRVYMTGTGSFVINNTTSSAPAILGPGGGIRAENCEMHIASSGLFGSVSLNTAGGAGGGISVSGERSKINLFTQDPLTPTRLASNEAGGVGGAIDIGSSALVNAWDVIIDLNTSRSGGGAVSLFDNDDNPEAWFHMRGTLDGAPNGAGASIGAAVNCAAFKRCNRIDSNAAIEAGGTRRTGAAIRVSASNADIAFVAATVILEGTEIVGNNGENLLELAGDSAYAAFTGVAMFNNSSSAELLHAPFDEGHLTVLWSTIAGNAIGGAATFRSSMNGAAGSFAGTQFKNSIHWQPGKRIYSVINGTVNSNNTDFLLSNDLTGMPVSTHNLVADPLFVNAAAQDYHLTFNSPAVDYAIQNPAAATADHLPRLVDLQGPANDNFGPQDLGAYERQFTCASDTIFCGGFE
jgi:hypothetical protein